MAFYSDSPIRFSSKSMVTLTPGDNDPEVGTVMREGDEDYIFVYNNGGSTINIGHGAVLSGVTGYSVTVSSVTGADLAVGVCKHSGIATTEYGWLVRRGFVNVEMGASDSCAAGQILALAVDGAFALKSNSTNHQSRTIGKAMAAIASGASGTAYISIY